MKQLLQEKISWEIPIAASAWPSAPSLGKRYLSTVSHHWNPAAEGEESIFIRKLMKRTFLSRMFVNRFFQQLLSWSPMEEVRRKLHDQRCNKHKCSGMWWSDFPFQIFKKNPKQPLVLVPKWQLRSLDNLLLKLSLGVLCDTYFSGAVVRLSLSPSSNCSTAQIFTGWKTSPLTQAF